MKTQQRIIWKVHRIRINSYTKATQGQLFVLEFQIFPQGFEPFPIKSIFITRYLNKITLTSYVFLV